MIHAHTGSLSLTCAGASCAGQSATSSLRLSSADHRGEYYTDIAHGFSWAKRATGLSPQKNMCRRVAMIFDPASACQPDRVAAVPAIQSNKEIELPNNLHTANPVGISRMNLCHRVSKKALLVSNQNGQSVHWRQSLVVALVEHVPPTNFHGQVQTPGKTS